MLTLDTVPPHEMGPCHTIFCLFKIVLQYAVQIFSFYCTDFKCMIQSALTNMNPCELQDSDTQSAILEKLQGSTELLERA